MGKQTRRLAQGAIIAALYVVLTHMQNALVPGSATWVIQLRLSEALCVLALFTPAATWGLSMGCLVFNISYAGALPLDFLVGSLASWLSAYTMWRSRRWTIFGYPLLSMLMPALCNGLLVGLELTVYAGGGFPMNMAYVAAGEAAVMLTLGTALYYAMKRRKLDIRLFG